MPNNIKSGEILGCRADMPTMEQALDFIGAAIEKQHPTHIVTLNPEMIYRAQKEPELKEIFSRAGLVTPDGTGTVWALRRAGYEVPGRITGIGLAENIFKIASARGWSIYLLGARPGVAEEAARRISREYPGIIINGWHHGYFNDSQNSEVVGSIKETRSDILLVGLGVPKQEYWISRHLQELDIPVCIGVGGAFDVLSGQVKRAPEFWRRHGLEWLYRLLQAPSRFKRQAVLPRFAFLVLFKMGRGKARNSGVS